MKETDKYLYLKRAEESLNQDIENSEAVIYINKVTLDAIKKEIEKVPKPKLLKKVSSKKKIVEDD